MAADGAELVVPGMCSLPDCKDITLVLDDRSKHPACKHSLAKVSEYFEKMFQGEYKESNSKEIEINDVSQNDLVVFLSSLEPFKPLPSDVDSLCSLIFLADRFMCPKLKQEIKSCLEKEVMYCVAAESKLKLLEVADANKGESAEILEACIRLCANLTIDHVSDLHGKVSDGTLAAVFALIGKMLEWERMSTASFYLNEHDCRGLKKRPYSRFTNGRLCCDTCAKMYDISSLFKPNFEKMKKIEIKKELFS